MESNISQQPPIHSNQFSYRAPFNSSQSQYHKQYHPKPASSFYVFQPRPAVPPIYQATEFDGKRLRKAIARKTVDYNSSVTKWLEQRIWQRDQRDRYALLPDVGYYTEVCNKIPILHCY